MLRRAFLFNLIGLSFVIAGCSTNPTGQDNDESCAPGSVSIMAVLSGSPGESGTMEYRELTDACREIIARVAGLAEGDYAVTVQEAEVGSITVGADGTGELIYDTDSQTKKDPQPHKKVLVGSWATQEDFT